MANTSLDAEEGRRQAKLMSEEEARRKQLLEEISARGYTQEQRVRKQEEVEDLEALHKLPSPPEQAIIVPDVRGMTSAKAKATLEKLGFKIHSSSEQSPDVKIPTVRAVQPTPGTEANIGQTVSLVVLVPRSVPQESEDSEASEEERQADEEARRSEFDGMQNEEAMEQEAGSEGALESEERAGQNRLQSLKDNVKSELQQAAKQELKVAAKEAAEAVTEEVVVATAPYWGTAVAVVILIIVVVIFAIVAVVGVCNQDGWAGKIARWSSTIASVVGLSSDVCKFVLIDVTQIDMPAPTTVTSGAPTDLVPLSYEPRIVVGGGTGDPRVRECMLTALTKLVTLTSSQQPPISWVVTSAYRAGAITVSGGLSAHGFGEAVDIVLQPPGSLTDPVFQQKIRDFIGLAYVARFMPPAGDVIDEYNNPTEATTGGHIHIEFNRTLNSDGTYNSYCDGTPTY